MRSWLVFAMFLTGACAPPDRPPSLPPELPGEAVDYLRPDTLRTARVAPGVWYRYLWSGRGPWAVHVLQVDLDRCELGLEVRRAAEQPGKRGGHARVSEMVAVTGEAAIAAVNGDFFTPEGTPLGPEVDSGELRTLRGRPALAWRPGGSPWIGTTRVLGDSAMDAGWRVPTGRPDADLSIIGGYPELLDGGARVGDLQVGSNPGFAASRHPRTAVGWDRDEDRLWLAVVDGRQGSYSSGMTLPELAGLFEALGAEEALNLDGGGSSVMVVRGRVVSRPSDEAGERPVVNALLLQRGAELCRLVAARQAAAEG